MAVQDTHIGKSEMTKNPNKAFRFILKENSVETEHVKNKAISMQKLGDDVTEYIDSKAGVMTDEMREAVEIATHPDYIGSDYYVRKWNPSLNQYEKTLIYVKGDTGNLVYPTAEVTSNLHLLIGDGGNFILEGGHLEVSF